ncbi:PBP1A family penicillin-binding protein [Hyphomicrobium sp.]|uniref:transglycosylase domain-containing protein n=1 Tax=Hyphomicrobium sp. TaxID=82 RepID=UPI0025C6E958|nr:PBP1A family penicillin-binding protein [Hyphomicrobium sp.]MCC7251180.1 PBP1A family penicillin-binding protein [Hyphomicrobium sp.]
MRYDGRDPRRPCDPEGRPHDPHWGPHPDWHHHPVPEPVAHAHASRLPLRWRLLFLGPLAVLSVAAIVVGALFMYYTVVSPDPLSMRPKAAGPVIRIMDRDGSPIAERGASRAYIPLDMLPPHAADAVVAIEDRRFFTHPGIDLLGTLRAGIANLRAGRLAQGGSTITQQLAKNLFLTSERTWSRKAEELVLALWLELKLSKRDILELYLNRVYFGGGAHGIEAASQRYFGKSARNLALGEAAVVAGLLKAPSRYAPSASPVQAVARGRVVIDKMREAGFINAEEAAAARGAEIRFSPLMRVPDQAEMAYAVDFVLDAAARFEDADRDEIVIETTLDAVLQRRAGEIVGRALAERGAALDAGQAAVVVLGPDGGIRALVGGRSYAESQFNRATRAHRQPGSAFKPVVYLTAVERGATPDTPVEDAPITAGRWSPRNDNGRYLGATTLRNALAQSLNTVAVRLLLDAGADKVAATARRLGMKSPLRTDASLALGTSEVSLLDLTGAYAAFANGGYVNEPYAIRRVRTGSGKVLFQRIEARSDVAIPQSSVAAMDDMLRAAVATGTGRRAAIPGRTVAGKTGTSQDFRDAWFVGYTSDLTASVWVGNDDGRTMNRVVGGALPAEIWREVMLAAHERKAPSTPPAGTVGDDVPSVTAAIDRSGRREEDLIAKVLAQETADRHGHAEARGETTVMPSGRIVVRPPELR